MTSMAPDEQRQSLQEVLWNQHAQPVGTHRDGLLSIGEYNWNFSNLDGAFNLGGALHNRKVFIFTCIEPQFLYFNGQRKFICIPVVVVIVSRFPPSDKVGFRSIERVSYDIIDMKNINLGWVPYIPPGERSGLVEPHIFLLRYVPRNVACTLNPEEILRSCIPYFNNPFRMEGMSVVEIVYQNESESRNPLMCMYDWELDDPESFANKLIDEGVLSRDHNDAFMALVNEKVEEAMRANLEDQEYFLHHNILAAEFESMRFYKFYPVATRDTPDFSSFKVVSIHKQVFWQCTSGVLNHKPTGSSNALLLD
ncbi:hypothetical protein E3N88_05067 [Mikania micrantha]|uniref:Uncharacterized protein n=1 Tax=Mikania micrantha TaxID=192012 RepID=A0A5N6PW91_9ASTR|nr:hypothetical protein E3N88_05067 [Mikania micrantha]